MKFQVFTKSEFKVIPADMFLVKNEHGWLFLQNEDAQWFVNHTQDWKDCPDEDNEKAVKAIVKAAKANMKLTPNAKQ